MVGATSPNFEIVLAITMWPGQQSAKKCGKGKIDIFQEIVSEHYGPSQFQLASIQVASRSHSVMAKDGMENPICMEGERWL